MLSGCIVVLLASAFESPAADRELSASIEVVKEYNDNIFFDTEKTSDFIIRIKPKVQVSNNTERTQMRFDAALSGDKYIKNPSLDTVQMDTQLSLSHAWSPRLSTAVRGYFKRDETQETELELAGIPSLREERLQYGGELSGTYALTEKWSVKAAAIAGATNYPEEGHPNAKTFEGQLDQSWQLTPRTAIGLLGTYSLVDYQDIPGTIASEDASNKTLRASVYWRHRYTEATSFQASMGYRFTWAEQTLTFPQFVITPDGPTFIFSRIPLESTDDGLIFSASAATKLSERLSATLSAGRDQYNSADATSVERNYIRSSLQYQLTERLSLELGPGYDYTVNDGPPQETNHYLRSSLALKFRLTERITAQLGGSYESIFTERDVSDFNRDRFITWASLTTEWPRLFSNN